MKELFLKYKKNYLNINCILLMLYSFFVLSTHVFATIDSQVSILRGVFLSLMVSIVLVPFLYDFINKLKFNDIFKNTKVIFKKKHYKIFYFLVPFVILLVQYLAFYHGGLSPDNIDQYTQSINNTYKDWHPTLQTIIAFKIPLIITNGWIGSIVLFQIIALSLSFGYSLVEIEKFSNQKVSIGVMLFFLLNPTVLNISMYPWKDVTFAIVALTLMTFLLKIIRTNGDWIKDIKSIIVVAIFVSLATLVRHNGILFTVPFLIAVLLNSNLKSFMLLFISSFVLIFLVKVPFYTFLNVQKPDRRQIETLGLPMSIIGEVVSNSPEKLDYEELEFAYKVAPDDIWKTKYKNGYNSVKWLDETNNNVIEYYGTNKVLHIMFQCIKKDPIDSIKGFVKTTNPVYTVLDEIEYNIFPKIANNSYGFTMHNNIFQRANYYYTKIVSIILPHIFYYIGSMHLIIIIVLLVKFKLNCLKNWKYIFCVIPTFAYNYGTMFLLTGAEDCFRFFYYTFLVTPIILLILLKSCTKEVSSERKA